MKDKSTPKNFGALRRRGISPFYSTVFFSKQVNALSARGARVFLSGRAARIVNGAARAIAYSSTRTFGCMTATFGLISILLHLGEYYFVDEPTVQLSTLVIGATFAILALPFVLFDVPMCTALQSFPVTDYIFFEFFSIKRMNTSIKVKGIHPVVGGFIGTIPAIVAFFVPIEYVVLVIAALIFVTVAFVSPEFPFLFFIMVLPYVTYIPYSSVVLVSLSLLMLLSFWRKVFLGKRTYFFGISDIFLISFALVIILADLLGDGVGSGNAWMLTVLSLAYVPAANIIVNRRLADCATDAMMISMLPTAVLAIAEYLINIYSGERIPSSSTTSSPESLATLLCVALVLILFSVKSMGNSVKRGFYIAFAVLYIIALVTTECIPMLLLLIVAVPSYGIVVHRRLPKELLIPFSLVPCAVFFLPSSVLNPISDFFGMSPGFAELRSELLSALRLMGDNILFGIGASAVDESAALPTFNLLIGLGCRFGIVAVAIFVLMILIRLRQISVYSRFLRHSQLMVLSDMTTLASYALVMFGCFFDLFADSSVYCTFFILMGMNTAALRISKHEHDDRHDYYGDQRSIDASNINILLR